MSQHARSRSHLSTTMVLLGIVVSALACASGCGGGSTSSVNSAATGASPTGGVSGAQPGVLHGLYYTFTSEQIAVADASGYGALESRSVYEFLFFFHDFDGKSIQVGGNWYLLQK